MLTCLEEIVAHTHNSCICLILVCCASYFCALMFINISSCMLCWLHHAYPIALSCLDLGLHFCNGRYQKHSTEALYEQRPYERCTDLIDLIQSLLGRCTKRCTKRSTYSATLFSRENRARALYRRCIEALYVQRPRQNMRQTYQNDHTLVWPPIYMPLWL